MSTETLPALRRPAAVVRGLWRDELVRGSVLQVLTTATTAVAGALFWVVAARVSDPASLGLATTALSAAAFLSMVALFGFTSSFLFHLPRLPDLAARSDHLTTGLVLAGGGGALLALAYLGALPWFAPDLELLRASPWAVLTFVVLTAALAVNALTSTAFQALRGAQWNLLLDGGLMSTVRLVAVVALAGAGFLGTFTASGLGALLAAIASVLVLVRRFGYRPGLLPRPHVLRTVGRFTAGTYVAYLLNIVPTLVVPVVVLAQQGPAASGALYLAFMVAAVVFNAAFAVTSATFAETSYAAGRLADVLKRSGLTLAALLVPVAGVLAWQADRVVTVFGPGYSGAGDALRVFALIAPLVAAHDLGTVVLRAQGRVRAFVVVNLVQCVGIVGGVVVLGRTGPFAGSLTGVALGWGLGTGFAVLVCAIFLRAGRRVVRMEPATGSAAVRETAVRPEESA